MPRAVKLAILSDIHYASAAEQARGPDFEYRSIPDPWVRLLVKCYRHYFWLRHPLSQNGQLERFLGQVGSIDYVIANGDYSCDSRFIGVSDDAACASVSECLGCLRARFGGRVRATLGDHELGKINLAGSAGGMRLASYHRARRELGLEPFWKLEFGHSVLLGVASSLVALPVFEPDTLPEERPEWNRLREDHLEEIRAAFSALATGRRVLLFCHDPTALPFLWREESVRRRLPQIEQTIIGHLHSHLVLWKSRLLAGMPVVRFLGSSVRRMSTALHQARHWKPFHVRLCPSLAGIELLKNGGFYTAELDPDGDRPAAFHWHRLPR